MVQLLDTKPKLNDTLKMLLINISLCMCLIGLITYTVMDKKGMFDEKVFVDTVVEREKYERLLDFVQKVKMPTLYDKADVSPFTNAVAGYLGGEKSSSYLEHTIQHEDLHFSYTALSTLPEYKEMIKKLEPVFTEDSVAVYETEGLFFWHDEKTDVYYLVKEVMEPTQPIEVTTNEDGEVMTTEGDIEGNTSEEAVVPLLTKEVIQKIVASLGDSTFEPNKSLKTYGADTSILQPTYHVDGKVASEISMDSVANAYSIIHFRYDQYSISQSNNFDYTSLIDKETAEKVNIENEVVYVSEDKKQFYYKNKATGVSFVINVESDDVTVEEVTKVIQSMLNEKTKANKEEE